MAEESTTPDLVELTHRVYGFLNSRDLDAVMGLVSETCVYDLSRWGLGTYTGREAVREFADDWLGTLHDYGVVVSEMEHLGSGVVCVAQVGHRERTPGGFMDLPSSVVALWEDGLLVQVTVYADPDEARAAAERLAQERG
jgi:ketosteroid isomerase-like protein